MSVAPHQITYVFSAVNNLTATTQRTQKDINRLTGQFTKLSGAIQNSFQFYVRYRIFSLINRGISAVENAIPALIARGQEWATTVDDISDSTGLAAEKSSLLAGVVQVMTGNAEGLTKALGALSAQAVNHGDVMKRYGIQTRDANGQLLDSWTLLHNVRKATSDLGNSFITTAAARDLFSRGGQTLMDFLTMSDAQFQLLARDVKESGVIMSDAALQAADQWGRTQQRFEMQVTGIANQIVMHVQPLLSRLVDGITNYLRDNMANIVGFVTGVISFVAGAIAGFLGIDISGATKTMAEQMDALADGTGKRERALSKAAQTRDEQTSTEDGYTRALNNQIEAIDRQLAAMAKSESAEDARREHARLMKDISDAKKELRDLRGEGIFAAGMSAAEAELARQAQAADIVAAQKSVREAQEKLAEQERDTARDNRRIELQERKEMLQQRLADHMKMLAEQAAADREVLGQIFGDDKGGIGGLGKTLAGVAEEAKKGLLQADIGTQWGKEFRTHLEGFFDDISDPETGLGSAFSKLVSVAQLVADNWWVVASIGAVIVGANILSSLTTFGMGLAAAGPALLGSAGLLVSLGLAAVALKMWADAIAGWQAQIESNRSTYEQLPNKPINQKISDTQGQIDLHQGYKDDSFGRLIFGTAHAGDEERSLAQAISVALADKTVTKTELQTYAGKVNELIGLMDAEGRSGTAWDEVLAQQAALNAALGEGGALTTGISALGAGLGPGSQFSLSMMGLGTAFGEGGVMTRAAAASEETAAQVLEQGAALGVAFGQEGPMVKTQQSSAQAAAHLAPYAGRTIAQHLQRIGSNTAQLSTSQPWGIANITLNIDGRTALRLSGYPITKGNSTTRYRPDI